MPSFWKQIGLAALVSVPMTALSFAGEPCATRPGCATIEPCVPHAPHRTEPPAWVEPKPAEPMTTEPMPVEPMPVTPEPVTPESVAPPTPLSFSAAEAGLGSPDVAFAPGGYIDNAIPRTRFTFRADAAYDNPTPDRAEFFYPKCGCFRGIDPNTPGPSPDNPVGNRIVETGVDYQELWFNMEYAFMDNASAFVELPVRFLNPDINDNEAGLGDVNFGMKYALIANADQFVTLQLRVYSPTGEGSDGLGTEHWSIEPAILYLKQVNQDWSVFGELRDWIPINGSDGPVFPGQSGDDYAGNVLRYGVGVAYNLIDNRYEGYQITPVFELVGWHVFDGFASSSPDGQAANISVESAKASIVNSKIGVRFTFGDTAPNFAGYGGNQSIYLGWGHALTNDDDAWYQDILRAEYRVNF